MGETERISWPGWEKVRLIGKGSFGAVYEIQRELFGETEKAALKVITIPQSDSDIEEMYSDGYDEASITSTFQNHLKSIISEYTLMRKLNGSANVVNCDDVRYVQHDDGIGWDIYIKMELLTPLNKVLSENIPEEQVLAVGRDICRALVLCKEYNIIHRDIKPQNIFVSEHKDYKLGDFGIAKTVEKTSGGTKIGTYKYMAPEVYHDEPYGAAADIYSLGLVLYWMLNERRSPFMPLPPEPASATMEEQARLRRFQGEPLPAPAHGSEELKRIVLKACAYAPKDRYQSAEEMLTALESLGKPTGQEPVFPAQPAEENDDPTEGFGWKEKEPEPEEDKTVGCPTPPSEENDEPTEGVVWKTLDQDTDRETDESTVGVWNNEQTQAETEPEKESKPKQQKKKKLGWYLVTSATVLVIIFLCDFQQGKKQRFSLKESIPLSVNREKHPKLGTMLFISRSIEVAANAEKIYFLKNPMAVNYTQWIAFAHYSYAQLKWVLRDKPEMRSAYINSALDEELADLVAKIDSSFENARQNSILVIDS